MGKSNQFRIIYFCVFCLGVLFLLTACATAIPAPKSNEDTLLVIKSRIEAEPGTTIHFPGNVKLFLEKGGKKQTIYINPKAKYKFASGIEPGNYLIKEYGLVSTNEPYKLKKPIHFTVKPGKLHVVPFVMVTRFYLEDNIVYYGIYLEKIEFKEKKEIIEDLKMNENVDLWEIDYTMPET